MPKLLFHPDVQKEVVGSFVWYESQAYGLGQDFITELEKSYQAILELPDVWPIFRKGFRRYLLARFPFAILYRQIDDIIYILAVMHQSRKPNYWVTRI